MDCSKPGNVNLAGHEANHITEPAISGLHRLT